MCESELDAALAEVRLIQTLRPPRNVAGAFPFLYPFVGVDTTGGETRFCLTTAPEAFPAFDLHGVFRSRHVTREAFFALMRLLRFLGHPVSLGRRDRRALPRYAHVYGFRRLPSEWPDRCRDLLRGVSASPGAALSRPRRARGGSRRSAEVAEDLRAVARFFEDEASPLAAVIEATGFPTYPVPQQDRDLLFLEYRAAARG